MPRRPKAPETPALLDAQPEETVTENAAATELVRLYPTHTAYIPEEPAIEREVTPEEAERLLAYQPPAYTTEPPDPPPAQEAEEQPAEPVEQTGSSDS